MTIACTATRLLTGGDYDWVTSNRTEANPCLYTDIPGDWPEEAIWTRRDGKALRIFTTTIPTEHRLYSLMHDAVYRLSVAYNPPTQPGFYLGEGMTIPPRARYTGSRSLNVDEGRGGIDTLRLRL